MKKLLTTLTLVSILSLCVAAQTTERKDPPADFKGDKCTLFPDGNYGTCCFDHDRDYYRGGTKKERRASDMRLYRCVRSRKGWQNEIAAPIMFLGVRVLGVSFLPTPFRWGFGQKKKK